MTEESPVEPTSELVAAAESSQPSLEATADTAGVSKEAVPNPVQAPEVTAETEPEPVVEAVPEVPVPVPEVIEKPATDPSSHKATEGQGGAIPLEPADLRESPASNGTSGTEGVDVLKPLNRETAKTLSMKAHAAVAERKREKLEKVMKLVSLKGSVGNDQVQLLLRVSDATATRYLGQLEREGRVGRIGRGNATRYQRL